MKTAEDLRKAFKARYPDVDNHDWALEHSGSVHEHRMTAIGVVLLASVLLRTTDVTELVKFTRYSRRFVHAIAMNMENSRLWKGGKYDYSGWSSVFPRNKREEREFWDHICIAEGGRQTLRRRTAQTGGQHF